MGLIKEQIEQIKSICFRWYVPAVRREIVTPEGVRFSVMDKNSDVKPDESDNLDKPQKQRGWVREEMVVLVAEYFRTKGKTSQESKESIQLVSLVLRNRAMKNGEKISKTFRNISGIQMQTACIIKYDPEMKEKGITGLTGGSRLMESIVNEYIDNPEKIKAEAYDVICKYSFSD